MHDKFSFKWLIYLWPRNHMQPTPSIFCCCWKFHFPSKIGIDTFFSASDIGTLLVPFVRWGLVYAEIFIQWLCYEMPVWRGKGWERDEKREVFKKWKSVVRSFVCSHCTPDHKVVCLCLCMYWIVYMRSAYGAYIQTN